MSLIDKNLADKARHLFFLSLLPLSSLVGLETAPWFSNVWEFTFTPSYTYSFYSHVQNGIPSPQYHSKDHDLSFDLTFAPSPNWHVDAELEFAETARQSMGYRSAALQVRYLWLDDLLGDRVSWTTGGVVRSVSRHSLKDVSCPYHANINFEINTVIGKEWDHRFSWRMRIFGGAALGMAHRGYPWIRGFTAIEGQVDKGHCFGLSLEGEAGFGHRKAVLIDHFEGYGFIRHRNIDVSMSYAYVFEIWGRLSLAYTKRLYARSFPRQVNFFTISYTLPFSLL